MTTSNHTQATVSFTKAASRLFLSISICKQLYTAPYLAVCTQLLLREESVPAVYCAGQLAISLTPRPMTVVFGLGTRLRVRMRTKVKNGVPANGSSSSAVGGGCRTSSEERGHDVTS